MLYAVILRSGTPMVVEQTPAVVAEFNRSGWQSVLLSNASQQAASNFMRTEI